jgi:hypothetical protein
LWEDLKAETERGLIAAQGQAWQIIFHVTNKLNTEGDR